MTTPGITTEDRVILFMDVHNFSIALNALTENRHSFLQDMYETLGDIVVEHKGEIVKYLGDAMLCLFPAGQERETVQCSLRLRRAFSGMISSRGLPSDTELEVGIGSGEVATGVFGHRSLRQRDVLGEEVNRVATIGHHRGIAITKRVYDEVKNDVETRRLPDVRVKWQDEPLRVWEVVE
jgi:adenylate cyclase